MKILVTGATGFVGRELVQLLVDEGHDVVALSRSPEKALKSLGLPIEVYGWNPSETLPPKAALDKVQAVVHLAGESVANGRWTKKQKQKILESRTQSTENLVKGIKEFGGSVESFVCASAIGFYGERGDEKLSESSELGQGFLAEVCRDWEKAAAGASDVTRTIQLRIGMVLGRDGALAKLLPLFRLGLGGPVGSGRQWVSWIHVQDVARLAYHCIQETTLSGPVNAVAPDAVTNKDFTKAMAGALGVPAFLPAPGFALKVGLGQMSELALKSQRVEPEKALASKFEFKFPTIDSAFREICPDPKRRCEESLTVNQFLEKPVEEVFPFFTDARNLEKITPAWLNFTIVGNANEKIEVGQTIDYKLRIRGIPIRWQSLIEAWENNQYFVDSQTKGPYKLWHHTHRFYPVKGGTLIRDKIRYQVPGGALGSLILGPLVRSDLQKIFAYRRSVIEDLYAN